MAAFISNQCLVQTLMRNFGMRALEVRTRMPLCVCPLFFPRYLMKLDEVRQLLLNRWLPCDCKKASGGLAPELLRRMP